MEGFFNNLMLKHFCEPVGHIYLASVKEHSFRTLIRQVYNLYQEPVEQFGINNFLVFFHRLRKSQCFNKWTGREKLTECLKEWLTKQAMITLQEMAVFNSLYGS